MIKNFLLFICFIVIVNNLLFGQFKYKYRIQFNDKLNSPYTITKPSEFLTDKSIDRRLKHHINLSENDLPVNPSYIDSIRKTGVKILNTSKWFNYVTIDTVNANSTTLNKIKAFLFVSNIDTVAKIKLSKSAQTFHKLNDKKFEFELNKLFDDNDINNISETNAFITDDYYKYVNSYLQVNMIACNYLHNMGFKGEEQTIAVLDGGFVGVDKLPAFNNIRNNNRIKGTKDFVLPGGNVYLMGDIGYFGYHGMYVLSIMAGNFPGNFIGTAPDADYWLLRTEDVRTENIIEEDNWVSGAEFADSVGVDVINSSLGYTQFDFSLGDHTYKDMDGKTTRISKAAAMAAKKGILVVVSAGNEGDKSWKYISAPADADSIFAVGGVDNNDKYANFSSQGPTYDKRIKPDIASLALGDAIASETGDIIFGNGTSFSSPVIAGMAACLWQTKPDVSNLRIIDVIKKSANHYDNPDYYTGYGIPNAAGAYLMLNGKEQNKKSETTLLIGPNPFTNEISVVFISPGKEDLDLELFDVRGKKVYEKLNINKNNEYKYVLIDNAGELQHGIYLLKVYSSGKIYTRKLIKMR